jgi:hypothetical protein
MEHRENRRCEDADAAREKGQSVNYDSPVDPDAATGILQSKWIHFCPSRECDEAQVNL